MCVALLPWAIKIRIWENSKGFLLFTINIPKETFKGNILSLSIFFFYRWFVSMNIEILALLGSKEVCYLIHWNLPWTLPLDSLIWGFRNARYSVTMTPGWESTEVSTKELGSQPAGRMDLLKFVNSEGTCSIVNFREITLVWSSDGGE